jgi:hypothetical protein
MKCLCLCTLACAVQYKIINRKGYWNTRYKLGVGGKVKMKPAFPGSTPDDRASCHSKPQYRTALLNSI